VLLGVLTILSFLFYLLFIFSAVAIFPSDSRLHFPSRSTPTRLDIRSSFLSTSPSLLLWFALFVFCACCVWVWSVLFVFLFSRDESSVKYLCICHFFLKKKAKQKEKEMRNENKIWIEIKNIYLGNHSYHTPFCQYHTIVPANATPLTISTSIRLSRDIEATLYILAPGLEHRVWYPGKQRRQMRAMLKLPDTHN